MTLRRIIRDRRLSQDEPSRASWILCSGAVVLLTGVYASSLVAAPAERVFTTKDLEEIRTAVVRYYEEKKPKHWEVFTEELKKGGIFLKEELPGFGPSIGIWKCEADEKGVDLVRDPGLSESGEPLAIQFYVHLIKKDGRWTAVMMRMKSDGSRWGSLKKGISWS